MITASPTNTAAILGLDHNGILWCDQTLQPGLYGCAKVSPACTNCYAEGMAARIVRMGGDEPSLSGPAVRYAQGLRDGRWTGRVAVDPKQIEPAFAKLPKKAGRIRRVFVTSMSDLFHADVPDEFLCKVFAEMRARPWIDFLVLTKRADRMAAFGKAYTWGWPSNVWAGVTVEDQKRADERIPYLLRVPAAVRFLSIEPMLGAIDLLDVRGLGCGHAGCDSQRIDSLTGADQCEHGYWGGARPERLSWVIVGSESDGNRPGARKTADTDVLDLVSQCDAAGVPVFVKQLEVDGRLCTLPMVNGRVRGEFPGAPDV